MFQLQMASTDVSGGNLAVAWCVDTEALKYLSDEEVQDPQVVIVVAPDGANYHITKEYRKVVPLKDLMTYLEFRTAGPNKIWAFISTRVAKDARNRYMHRERDQFDTDVLTQDGSALSIRYYTHELLQATPISVEVPKAAFAKELSAWEKVWVNHWFRSKPQDQCDYRRRRLLAYTVQPVVFLLDVLVARLILSSMALLWVSRGLSLKYFLHPLRYSFANVLDVFEGGSWLVAHLPEDNGPTDPDLTLSYVFRKFWKTPLMPASLLVMGIIYHFHIVIWAAAVVAAVITLVALSLLFASGSVSRWINDISLWLAFQEKVLPWYMEKEEIEHIVCNPGMKARTSVASLPPKHRTIRLRFQDVKAKVCRPFSS